MVDIPAYSIRVRRGLLKYIRPFMVMVVLFLAVGSGAIYAIKEGVNEFQEKKSESAYNLPSLSFGGAVVESSAIVDESIDRKPINVKEVNYPDIAATSTPIPVNVYPCMVPGFGNTCRHSANSGDVPCMDFVIYEVCK
jgi:hypothetical protein